jgi:glycerol-3-phosphate acyltransferase PlsY
MIPWLPLQAGRAVVSEAMLLVLFGYAVGSVPFAYILARRAGIVRVGSGNNRRGEH